MKFIGDFHIHSHFSLATSKELCPGFLDYWAGLKGIQVIGTGDFTHPGWLEELKEQLEPAEEGLLKLKREYKKKLYPPVEDDVRFVLTAEISSIYRKKGEVRKVHNLVFAPSFSIAEKIQKRLKTLGFNISSDGRPIIGMDSRDLLELCLDSSENIFFVPAHIWTPWFSVLGSKSGFDSVSDCFEDLTGHISAIEMGLSTDPPMNWMCSFLDTYTLTANSDAHSPEKLGRNANLFDTELSYKGITEALKPGNSRNFLGTVNFFPQEGKYHYDGHRKCSIRWNPLDTLQHDEICPVCGKKITVGVMTRIAQLADRDDIMTRPDRHPFYSLIPLKELLAEIECVSPDSVKVDQHYKQLLHKAGSEFNLLLHNDLSQVKNIGGEVLCEAVRRMRNREVQILEGYDGEFGRIKVFREGETKNLVKSSLLFEETEGGYITKNNPRPLLGFDLEAYRRLKQEKPLITTTKKGSPDIELKFSEEQQELNDDQENAVKHFTGPAIIMAGPGTGKTKVLTSRIAYLIQKRNINPGNILAVTFTNKAAGEMKDRLLLMPDKPNLNGLNISTFHSFGLSVIKEFLAKYEGINVSTVIDEDDKENILQGAGVSKSDIPSVKERISEIKQSLIPESGIKDPGLFEIYKKYNRLLRESYAFDFDDLVSYPVQIFRQHPDFLARFRERIQWMLVDEYQDINLPQYEMIRMLMPGEDSNLFVIGDPDQAIYGFRGADVGYIQKFRDDYRNAAIFRLKKSYRCSGSILRASGNILGSDPGLLQGRREGVKIIISENATDKSEAEYIARTIERMIGGVGFFSIDSEIAEGTREKEIESLSDFAILCRISRQMVSVEKALKDHNIPFQKIGEEAFLKQEPVKTLLDVYRSVSNPGNIILRSRLLKKKIISEAGLRQLSGIIEGNNLVKKLELIISNYFRTQFAENRFLESMLLDFAGQYLGNEDDFAKNIVLGTGIDTWKPKSEAVNLMTLHASKGLEFKCVFITGCEDNLIPYSIFHDKAGDTEEERRLLYVGMTRAMHYLFLTHARQRLLMGREYTQNRSHFLDQIEKELKEEEVQHLKVKEKKDPGQLELF